MMQTYKTVAEVIDFLETYLDSTVFTRKWLTPQAVILPLYPDLFFR